MSFGDRLAALPLGTFRGHAHGRDWIVTRSLVSGGRGEKLVAEALDGSDYISLNLYRLTSGELLKPCEMSDAKVRAFVAALTVLS
ncbi:hypothetical protein [Thalassorhabdomicrobium marinisediminis]|uniref:Peptide methionine sulfoxide reductase n=1 Tax=Thalassorhabdomicrobium marinisediminis TaxID=2170577 RepID=A0A2T7FYU6_9RHOB|nr:hypothetical protein [Thalassorhabdomicrobium marinisediminis]PVA07331.1 hypothetical protein DC363_05660 [Thalassorhabdomicrobium marinisediminis]